ncbi:MAG: ABC transporter ATP-binding protein [Bulleidia sp.]
MNIHVEHLTFGYDERTVFNDLSFDLPDHSCLAVLGPNGAGKTTLLRCLLGFVKCQGKMTFDGKTREQMEKGAFWKQVSYVPQATLSTFTYSVEETVLMGRTGSLSIFEKPKKHDYEKAEQAMKQAGILHLQDRDCASLSGGELQLVHIARALCSDPRLIVMDEPETGLDFSNQLMVLELIQKLHQTQQITIIFNTHYPDHALDYADHALLIDRQGHSVFGQSSKIITTHTMADIFDVEVELFTSGKDRHAIIPVSRRTQS